MLVIPCPSCGPRDSSEFTYKGEAKPRPPADAERAEWREYLYMRKNTLGWQVEQWFHQAGCRSFFVVERHTATNEFRSTEAAPQ